MNDIAPKQGDMLFSLIVDGDVSKLSPVQKVEYYSKFCESLGLNPLTKPFDYIKLQGKEVLYAKKDATEQLRKLNGVSVTGMESKQVGDVWITQVSVMDKTGRTDIATGAVTVKNLSGDALANAVMKCETKAKRRATLSICGLGVLDEMELETIPAAVKESVNVEIPQIPENTEPEKPVQNHSNASPDAHVLSEGEVIGVWFWKLTADQRKQYIPEGCKYGKVNGSWTVIKAA